VGNFVLYDCRVGVDALTGEPTLDSSGYAVAACPPGSQPGYYLDEQQWHLVSELCSQKKSVCFEVCEQDISLSILILILIIF
jgi:hypothetical protein